MCHEALIATFRSPVHGSNAVLHPAAQPPAAVAGRSDDHLRRRQLLQVQKVVDIVANGHHRSTMPASRPYDPGLTIRSTEGHARRRRPRSRPGSPGDHVNTGLGGFVQQEQPRSAFVSAKLHANRPMAIDEPEHHFALFDVAGEASSPPPSR